MATFTCVRFRKNAGALIDGELAPIAGTAMTAHAQTCADCRELLDALAQTRASVGEAALNAPAGLRTRVMASVYAEGASAVSPAPAKIRRRPYIPVGTLAAAAIAAVILITQNGLPGANSAKNSILGDRDSGAPEFMLSAPAVDGGYEAYDMEDNAMPGGGNYLTAQRAPGLYPATTLPEGMTGSDSAVLYVPDEGGSSLTTSGMASAGPPVLGMGGYLDVLRLRLGDKADNVRVIYVVSGVPENEGKAIIGAGIEGGEFHEWGAYIPDEGGAIQGAAINTSNAAALENNVMLWQTADFEVIECNPEGNAVAVIYG